MSDLIKAVSAISKEAEDIRNKEKEIWKAGIESKHEELKRRQEEQKHVESINLDLATVKQHILKAQQDNSDYMKYAKQSISFLNDSFRDKVPFFAKNLILVAAKTGDGKSTTTANLAYHCMLQNKKVLVITNEEAVADVYNRVTCLIHGWAYVNHDKFTDQQNQAFSKYMDILSTRMLVVDDNYGGGSGQTTTLEGITALLESLIINNTHYDAIIIDYYQNIERSTKCPSMKNWEVQERIANYLDQYKNRYLTPLVVLAQLKTDKDDKVEFKEALEGRKSIHNKATCSIKMVAERDLLRTAWKIMKSRFSSAVGQTVFTGFDRGKFIEYTTEFQNGVEVRQQEKEMNKLFQEKFKKKKANK